MRFELADLRAFVAVAELASFRAAANAIHLSQPALSRRIDKLERALGCRLFDRSTHHVALTVVGQQFERSARQLLDELEVAVLALPDERGRSDLAEVRIACVRSAFPTFMAPALIECRRRFPEVRVRALDTGANEVVQAVLHGQADFGLSFVGKQAPDIDFTPIFNDEYLAICPPAHPLARKRQLAWRELLGDDYLALTRDNGSRLLQDIALAHAGLHASPAYEVRHISTLIALVEAGLGVAALPRLALPQSGRALRSVALVDPVIRREFGLLRRRAVRLKPAPAALFEFFAKRVPATLRGRRRRPA
ncbi:MAG: LysR family transcriptional regulator [Burkholderiales bacterium]